MSANYVALELMLTKSGSALVLHYELSEPIANLEPDDIPSNKAIETWLIAAHKHMALTSSIELGIRVIDDTESAYLNSTYRGKSKSTNVLSFVNDVPDYVETDHIGDLAICAPVVKREAKEQGKSVEAHWSHMCIHGLLHLLGYDHIHEKDAQEMEALEVAILGDLGFQDPYIINETK
ncbi:rRNA maturation RNase YbeY [Ningiella sp. W23]|uniref:rRNA maturation RNase YbeY n=1 Tax=Ningiella sp. W23 TaxID=3023715 RepID=UPI0037562FC1